ncbi:NAD(P)/FAD-dependent oxidoreductase [Trichocoleus sp. FACHB-262]|nr:NAD(P)/FAD-dependent oxidoreductase [Trichocoleus sp. FACHB-262]
MYCKKNRLADQPGTLSVLRPGRGPVQICILGGGFGGLYTALYLQRTLGSQLKNYQITLVEPKDHFLFTPLLYELVTGELQAWEIAPTYRQLLAHNKIEFCQEAVSSIDLTARYVYLCNGDSLTYDYLVLAVGGETCLGSIPGAVEHAAPFRSLADAVHLRERLRFLEASRQHHIRVTVVGGGPNGVELACKLADRLKTRGQVRLIERGDRILKTFSAASRAAAYKALRQRGIQVELNTGIEALAANHITLAHQEQTRTIETDLVLWTAGTQTLDWVRSLPCQQNTQGQLLTLPTLQLVEHPEVFALGDLAAIQDAGKQLVPATAQAAYQQASCAARNLRAVITEKPLLSFRYLHLGEMLTLGTNAAVVCSFGLTLQGAIACVIRHWIYLQRMPTLHHRLRVMGHWLASGLLRWLPTPTRQPVRQAWQRLTRRSRRTVAHYPRRLPY